MTKAGLVPKFVWLQRSFSFPRFKNKNVMLQFPSKSFGARQELGMSKTGWGARYWGGARYSPFKGGSIHLTPGRYCHVRMWSRCFQIFKLCKTNWEFVFLVPIMHSMRSESFQLVQQNSEGWIQPGDCGWEPLCYTLLLGAHLAVSTFKPFVK